MAFFKPIGVKPAPMIPPVQLPPFKSPIGVLPYPITHPAIGHDWVARLATPAAPTPAALGADIVSIGTLGQVLYEASTGQGIGTLTTASPLLTSTVPQLAAADPSAISIGQMSGWSA